MKKIASISSFLLSPHDTTNLKLQNQAHMIIIPKKLLLEISETDLSFDLVIENGVVSLLGRKIHSDNSSKEPLYFTQNNIALRLRCPECVRTKTLRHCKVFKNLPALWWHIKQEHKNISNLEFNIVEIIQVLNGLDKAIQWKIL
jgi:hypothetical protein